ncbi:hypothetical protein M2266_006434 [Streptomyces sp. SPB162]|nr:hypothetical protein [Streptomyces sp. SPB162]
MRGGVCAVFATDPRREPAVIPEAWHGAAAYALPPSGPPADLAVNRHEPPRPA